ncbi:polysaccharide deacetylase [Rhizobium sp. CFBP 8762]|uniref:polysaccharide deacetylase n=1 Tax=Rhizobium sp. CFBP 8762 TaxID=2775279 RepID=UPI001FD607AA|nr:polysaccharide deacetylase [Rhizobium sp. CFBP 8762]
MSRLLVCLPLLGLAFPAAAAENVSPAADARKQLVVVSFDGAHDNRLWDKSLDMAARTGAHFTYFLSCTFLMTRETGGNAYQAPGHKAGKSNVGFGQTADEVQTRLRNIWKAHTAGHDIGSHACGHFDGKDWTEAEWVREFSSFRAALRDGWKNNGLAAEEPQGWQDFAQNDIKGFRVPYLSQSAGLVPALKRFGFSYDASLVSKGPAVPELQNGLVRFALPLIPEGPSGRRVIGMDYNLFVRHSMGVENRKDSGMFEERTLKAYRDAFNEQYTGKRIPLQLGFHFVEMNGGAYWRALDRFLTEVCGKPDVACVSHAQALQLPEARQTAGPF